MTRPVLHGVASALSSIFSVSSVLLVLAVAGCSSQREVQIVTEPVGAQIEIENATIGKAPFTHVFDFAKRPTYVVRAALTGYFTANLEVSKDDLSEPELKIPLKEDESWKYTTTSEATNQWLKVQINPSIAPEIVWQKLVDSVTDRYSGVEQLDNNSGYIRSTAIVKRFKGPDRDFSIRTRVLGSIASRQPLVYKIKIEADKSEKEGEWINITRVFKEDATLIEEIQNRLGVTGGGGLTGTAGAAAPATPPSTTAPAASAFCTSCGGKIALDAKFCPGCGKQQ